MARTLSVSRFGFYAHIDREPCTRDRDDAELTKRIKAIHIASREMYGALPIHAGLIENGLVVDRNRGEMPWALKLVQTY